jgi:AraC family transcriptional regulator of adaptative response / DNA-3-methyladenine glycosylase II
MNMVIPEIAQQVSASRQKVMDELSSRLIKALLTQTQLPLGAVASHAGLANPRALDRETQRLFKSTAGQVRAKHADTDALAKDPFVREAIGFELPVQGPYDLDWVFDYLAARALQGIETVKDRHYQRRVSPSGAPSVFVNVYARNRTLHTRIPLNCGPARSWLARVVRLFDLGVDSRVIDRALKKAAVLGASVAGAPGLRVPGAWDGFESAVRAVLGQQVSVARGTELANRMIEAYGGGDFPAPTQLVHQEIAELGMPGNRGRAISTLSQWVAQQARALLEGEDTEAFVEQIASIKGIGPWTQNYMRLRIVKNVDAFPHNDWVVLKQLQTTPAQALTLSASWRPWRAYALMHIWRMAGLERQQSKKNRL